MNPHVYVHACTPPGDTTVPKSARFGSFFINLCFTTCLDYQPAMEIASPIVTTPRSTRSIEPATTSTPALGGAESLSPSEDPSFRQVWPLIIAWKMKIRKFKMC